MEALLPTGLIEFTVFGEPVPKGSMRAFTRRKAGVVVGVGVAPGNEKRSGEWKARVHAAAQAVAAQGTTTRPGPTPMLDGPVCMIARFWLTKPVSAPKRRRTWPMRKPDLDKLLRGLLDPLVGVLIADDARVISIVATKDYVPEGGRPGVDVRLWPVDAEIERGGGPDKASPGVRAGERIEGATPASERGREGGITPAPSRVSIGGAEGWPGAWTRSTTSWSRSAGDRRRSRPSASSTTG